MQVKRFLRCQNDRLVKFPHFFLLFSLSGEILDLLLFSFNLNVLRFLVCLGICLLLKWLLAKKHCTTLLVDKHLLLLLKPQIIILIVHCNYFFAKFGFHFIRMNLVIEKLLR